MTDVANWNDPPAIFQIDGPFEAGVHGSTLMPGQEARKWHLRDVSPPHFYVLEMDLDGAVMSFEWRFDNGLQGGTQLTQHISLKGGNAATYLPQVEQAFGANLSAGMEKIASAMEAAIREVGLDDFRFA